MTLTSYNKFLEIHTNIQALKNIFPRLRALHYSDIYTALLRLERKLSRLAVKLANGLITQEEFEKEAAASMLCVDKLTGFKKAGVPVKFNRDPRGHALKIASEWVDKNKKKCRGLTTDWGGFGILFPGS